MQQLYTWIDLNRQIAMQRVTIFVLWLCVTCIAWPAHANLFTVAKDQFSRLVKKDGTYEVVGPFEGNVISKGALDKKGRLYFSFTIHGYEAAIKRLQDVGHLDVTVHVYAGGMRRETVQIGITQNNWDAYEDALLQQFKSNGYFVWKTYMFTVQTMYPSIEIIVRDARNSTITSRTVSIVP